jgi:hypothetical protein
VDRRQLHPSPRSPAATISLSSEQGKEREAAHCAGGGEERWVDCKWCLTEGAGVGRGFIP